jgi:hypothetical protein
VDETDAKMLEICLDARLSYHKMAEEIAYSQCYTVVKDFRLFDY